MKTKRKALIVGVNLCNQPDFAESMAEMENLAIACDYEVVGRKEQNLKTIHPTYYIGQGKVLELKDQFLENSVDTIVFNDELSPSQIRNLEKEWDCKVLDRTTLILEIFANRAKTREAKLQVEVAQLKYSLTKIVGSQGHLGRQGGGSGMRNRGSGEKKLELDRRRIESRISQLEKDLANLDKERSVQKKLRASSHAPKVALVGYTNAGKSTVLNAMVDVFRSSDNKKKVFEKDMLFATLETSVRRIDLPGNHSILLSDTVGFVNRLPHELIKAFRSTLAEVADADLLLHVIDISHPNWVMHKAVTEDTLKQIGAGDVPALTIFNKCDLLGASQLLPDIGGITISARQKINLPELIRTIQEKLFQNTEVYKFLIPYDQGNTVSYLNENGSVKDVRYEPAGTLVEVECRQEIGERFKEYRVKSQ